MQPRYTAGSSNNTNGDLLPILGSGLHPLGAQNASQEVTPSEVKLLICHNFQVFLLPSFASVNLLQVPPPKSLRKAHQLGGDLFSPPLAIKIFPKSRIGHRLVSREPDFKT